MALAAFFTALAGPVVKRALAAIGVGYVSYLGLSAALNAAISSAQSSWSGLSGDSLSIIQLAGVGQAISILCGGLVARAAMLAIKRLQVLS